MERSDADESRAREAVNAAALKGAYVLGENVKAFVEHYGVNACGMLTLTIGDKDENGRFVPLEWRSRAGWIETQRRMHNASRRLFPSLFKAWVWVREPTRKGGMHLHLVVACREDIRPGVDLEAFARGDYSSAGGYLRGLWSTLRDRLPELGFGRHELTPLRSTKEAVACYVGKYIGKGYVAEVRYKPGHGRRVGYSRAHRVATLQMAWTVKGRAWRAAVRQFAESMGVRDLAQMTDRYGPRWAWTCKERIIELAAAAAVVTVPDDLASTPAPDPAVVAICKAFGCRVPAPVLYGPRLPVWLRTTAEPFASIFDTARRSSDVWSRDES